MVIRAFATYDEMIGPDLCPHGGPSWNDQLCPGCIEDSLYEEMMDATDLYLGELDR